MTPHGLYSRIAGVVTNEDIIDQNTGEILAEAGQKIDKELARQIENAGTQYVMAQDPNDPSRVTKVIGNQFVDLDQYIEFDVSDHAPQDQ